MKITVNLPSASQIVRAKGLDADGDVQKMLTQIICGRMTRFMPASSETRVLATKKKFVKSPTEIEVTGPYAHYQYDGEVWGPNIPIKENGVIVGWRSPPIKHPTGRRLQYSPAVNPDAGPLWDERLVEAEGDAIKADVERYIARRQGK